MSIEDQVFKKIKNYKRGKIFFPANFSKLGSEDAIHQALKRLTEKGILVRIAHGIYLYPKTDSELGILYPPIDEIAKAIAKRDKARIIPTGAQALNLLGLSTQVPMKVVYLTDGAQRNISIGNQSIKFKKTSPRNLATKGEISGLIIQALREIGKDNASADQLRIIHEILQKEDPANVRNDAGLAPAWISRIMSKELEN
ncbi:MAG: hypothetical protein AMS26_22740 [Bacteroides sp. SM23_62]|nr:MAG: hypothetical protein AMS26_22740 [Bacteroides sp. SM23_62]